jgi:hypothetical protein
VQRRHQADRRERLRGARWTDREDDGFSMTSVLLVLLVGLLLLLAVRVGRRFFAMLRQPSPSLALFGQLARVHELDAAEQKTLRKIARRAGLANPALLFVQPQHLRTHMSADPAAARIYLKLFGG